MRLIDDYEVAEVRGCVRLIIEGDQALVLSPEEARVLATTLNEFADVADLDSEEKKAERVAESSVNESNTQEKP